MKIKFEAPLGQRTLRRYVLGITTYDLWWCYETKRWIDNVKKAPGMASTYAPCKSYKAFLRHLRKHPELKGHEVVLVSRLYDNDIIARV
jgi:hypothetical protein